MTEDQLQADCFKWGNNRLPIEDRKLLWAVPNGGSRKFEIIQGKRVSKEGMKLKATGVIPGVHDLHLFLRGKFFTFELKVNDNTLSDDQIEWGEKVKRNGGYVYAPLYTLESFKFAFEDALFKSEIY